LGTMLFWSSLQGSKEGRKSFVFKVTPQGINGMDGIAKPFGHPSTDKTPDTLSTYRGEALIIHGTEDETVPLEHAYRFKKVLPSSRLRKIEGAGHTYNQVDWEEEVLRETVNFLKEKL